MGGQLGAGVCLIADTVEVRPLEGLLGLNHSVLYRVSKRNEVRQSHVLTHYFEGAAAFIFSIQPQGIFYNDYQGKTNNLIALNKPCIQLSFGFLRECFFFVCSGDAGVQGFCGRRTFHA